MYIVCYQSRLYSPLVQTWILTDISKSSLQKIVTSPSTLRLATAAEVSRLLPPTAAFASLTIAHCRIHLGLFGLCRNCYHFLDQSCSVYRWTVFQSSLEAAGQ